MPAGPAERYVAVATAPAEGGARPARPGVDRHSSAASSSSSGRTTPASVPMTFHDSSRSSHGGTHALGGGAPVSSASAYAPLTPDAAALSSPPLGGAHALLAHHAIRDRPSSLASSHMLGPSSDYDSVHQLNRYTDTSGRGSTLSAYSYAPTPGTSEEHALQEKGPHGFGAAAEEGTYGLSRKWPQYADPRAAGLAKYGTADKTPLRKKLQLLGLIALIVGVLAIVIVVPISQTLLKKDSGSGATKTSSGPGTGPGGSVLTSGGNGTEIRMENGTTFIYVNALGGEWHSGILDNGARAQDYSPRLNETWDYKKNRLLGVNLGGWLVLEPFIVPALFEPYENNTNKVVDEYTLSTQWISEGGTAELEKRMRQHYDTFITEKDFAEIAAAGLNWIRLPIGFWALETIQDEPYLRGVAWEYFLKAIKWARKYGLRINLDLHAVPGSQNNYNHSGRLGAAINFLNGPMGIVNAQRALNYIRTITEFISQPDISPVVPMFSILNEPNLPQGIGQSAIRSFYNEVYNVVRNVTGTGQGKGPIIMLHDGFLGLNSFSGFLTNSDRVAWDIHPYVAFTPPYLDWSDLVAFGCNNIGTQVEYGLSNLGITVGGEWSLATNDCGLYLNGVGDGIRFDGSYNMNGQTFPKTGDCPFWDNWQNFTQSQKDSMRNTALAQYESLGQGGAFFWTWKIGNSQRTGAPVNPNWSYKLGIDQGWMPKDPFRDSQGACKSLASSYTAITRTTTWEGNFQDWQTGGGSAPTNAPATSDNPWPPSALQQISSASNMLAVSSLPSYTPTGAILTAPAPKPTASVRGESAPAIGAWFNTADTAPMYTAISGCSYPGPYAGTSADYAAFPCPSAVGGGGAPPASRRDAQPTPAPALAPRGRRPRAAA